MKADRRRLAVPLSLVLLAVGFPARAQTACKTPNCVIGGKPAVCANRAASRIPNVNLTVSGINFVFDPSNPKIEPGDCIQWTALSVTHSSSENHATATDDLCTLPPALGTLWDSGNISAGAGANSSSWCAYEAATFPAGTGDGYYCRIHATQAAGTMRGTLRVTTPIVLTVDKSVSDARLSWSGGGVTGDVTYKVARSANDPAFAPANVQTTNPDGGVTGVTYLDVGALVDPTTRYYLVRNKQTNEP